MLSVLYKAYPYTPQAYLYCDDTAVIGAQFFVMERCQGIVIRTRIPEACENFPDAPRQMSRALVDALADFHAVNYATVGLGDLGKPDGFIRRQIEGWYRRWEAAKTEEVPEIDNLYAWLEENQPLSQWNTLVHNDFKLNNTMLDSFNPGRVVAVFD